MLNCFAIFVAVYVISLLFKIVDFFYIYFLLIRLARSVISLFNAAPVKFEVIKIRYSSIYLLDST